MIQDACLGRGRLRLRGINDLLKDGQGLLRVFLFEIELTKADG